MIKLKISQPNKLNIPSTSPNLHPKTHSKMIPNSNSFSKFSIQKPAKPKSQLQTLPKPK